MYVECVTTVPSARQVLFVSVVTYFYHHGHAVCSHPEPGGFAHLCPIWGSSVLQAPNP